MALLLAEIRCPAVFCHKHLRNDQLYENEKFSKSARRISCKSTSACSNSIQNVPHDCVKLKIFNFRLEKFSLRVRKERFWKYRRILSQRYSNDPFGHRSFETFWYFAWSGESHRSVSLHAWNEIREGMAIVCLLQAVNMEPKARPQESQFWNNISIDFIANLRPTLQLFVAFLWKAGSWRGTVSWKVALWWFMARHPIVEDYA